MFAHQHDVISLGIELKIDRTFVRKEELVTSLKLLPKRLLDKTWEVIKMGALWHF